MNQQLLEQFEDYLINSGFTTDDVIPSELELAEKFCTSRGAIREVIQHYAQLGLLKRVKKRGTVLQALKDEKLNHSFSFCLKMGGFCFEELKETRLLLESAIAPLILQRISPVTLEKLEQNLAQQEKALQDPELFEKLDQQFHKLLFECCQNRVLSLFANILSMLFLKRYRKKFITPKWTVIGFRSHTRILQALKAGDLEKFRDHILTHINPT